MDLKNCKGDSPEMVSSPKGDKSAMIEKFDHKRNAEYEIIPCTILKGSVRSYCQEKGHWMRSCRIYLKDHKDGKVKMYDSTSGKSTI